jgi:TetR/AcrR family transcriptional regulator
MHPKAVMRHALQKSNNRLQIMQAAVELFSEHGFHKVSMRAIAEESGFSTGTLYNFFRDKEDLYHTLVKEHYHKFHDALAVALDGREGDTETERIRAYITEKGRLFQNNRSMLKLYFEETKKSGSDIKTGLDAELRSIYDDFIQRLASVFEIGMRKGTFRRVMEPYYLAIALASMTNAFLFLWLEDARKHPYEGNIEKMMQLMIESITVHPGEAAQEKAARGKKGTGKEKGKGQPLVGSGPGRMKSSRP